MTDAQRRYMHARQRVEATLLNPTMELLTAAKELVAEAQAGQKAAVDALEELRPHWAQGYTSDSIAAQAATTALSELWKELGVTDQTAAMAAIRELRELASS